MDLGLSGKVALVTGASSGLGLAIARELAAEGAAVAIVARRADVLEREAAAMTKAGPGRAVAIAGDITAPGEAERVVREAERVLGAVGILVANQGGPPATTFDTTTEEQYRAAIELNLLSSIRLTYACVPGMRQRKWGRVIFQSSMAAKMSISNLMLSNTARAGLLGFAKTLANEVAADGVTVNTVLPGHFDTQRALDLARMKSERSGQPAEEILNARLAHVPAGRAGEPREMGAVVAFLASERASYVTGTAIQVDGGIIPTIV